MTCSTKIKKAHWNLIIDRMHQGRCVPFLGAAVNASCDGYKGLPISEEVAASLINKIGIEDYKEVWNYKDLARISLVGEFETDRPQLMTYIKEIIPDEKCTASPFLKILVNLNFKLIITTNYDRLLEKALEGKKYEIIVQPANGFKNTKEIKDKFEKLEEYKDIIIYKIHGSFFEENIDSDVLFDENLLPIIITEDDYIEFLTIVGRENIGVPRIILKKLIPSTLLFIGYSLKDLDFRTIYKGLIEPLPKHQKRKSFAIQKDPTKFWVEFWKNKGIEIYNVDLKEFIELLKEKYYEKYG